MASEPLKTIQTTRQMHQFQAQIDLHSVTDLQIALNSGNSVTELETPGS